ncbi:MAG TPA: AGE family epimerase/isomerase [Terracidiphilus sp.]|jgi:mannobiose 2-epimerase
MNRFALLLASACLCHAQSPAATPASATSPPTRDTYLRLAAEMDTSLRTDVLNVWFPRSIDTQHGGFHSHFARDWKELPSDGKFSVFQGRMTWVASQTVMREPTFKDRFTPIVHHGVDYLASVMWDKQDGGFFWGLDDNGQITPEFTSNKHLYGIGFCIYGAAAAYQATHDPEALALAQNGFRWIEQHAHDSAHGGYFEWLTRNGTPIIPDPSNVKAAANPIGPANYKSMNTHIHLLEALTELYQVWPDPTLRARLEELLAIVRDKICVEPGAMNLYFTNAWQPIPDHDSFGHDVETAYLMLETDELLHHHANETTERMAKMLVDHALAYGWDTKNGGFFREGTTFGKPEDTTKEWWAQFEGLNALLMMHQRYGASDPRYFQAFLEQWAFIRNHTIDSQFHGDYNLTTADGSPQTEDKGSIWKAAYHDGRALWNVRDRLNQLANTQ